ncbi:hypothetical protein HDU86_007697 [Geranomyces michiganensis]|nr:hypothetical protein HDU86_007697 [Geranomyces michiganensis]
MNSVSPPSNEASPPPYEAGPTKATKISPAATPLRSNNLVNDALLISDDDDADLIAPNVFQDAELFRRSEHEAKLQKLAAAPKRKALNIDALLADKRKQERRAREAEALDLLMQQEEQEGDQKAFDLDVPTASIVPEEAVETMKDLLNHGTQQSSKPTIIRILKLVRIMDNRMALTIN